MNEHPDFEALSAFVDGEAPQWRRHVDACDLCLADVARLRAVRAADRPAGAASGRRREGAVDRPSPGRLHPVAGVGGR